VRLAAALTIYAMALAGFLVFRAVFDAITSKHDLGAVFPALMVGGIAGECAAALAGALVGVPALALIRRTEMLHRFRRGRATGKHDIA
jgi:prepilin signal peptidase PulO-like enzyme (type II secretory pathway)